MNMYMSMFMTLHNGFMFVASRSGFKHFPAFQATSLENVKINVVMNGHGHNNIRNGIVCDSLHVIQL